MSANDPKRTFEIIGGSRCAALKEWMPIGGLAILCPQGEDENICGALTGVRPMVETYPLERRLDNFAA
jgi:hypothetical protein